MRRERQGTRNERGRKIRARSVGREPWKNSRNFYRVLRPFPTIQTNRDMKISQTTRSLCDNSAVGEKFAKFSSSNRPILV